MELVSGDFWLPLVRGTLLVSSPYCSSESELLWRPESYVWGRGRRREKRERERGEKRDAIYKQSSTDHEHTE